MKGNVPGDYRAHDNYAKHSIVPYERPYKRLLLTIPSYVTCIPLMLLAMAAMTACYYLRNV